MPGRRVAHGVLHEVERHPVQLVARAVDDRGLRVDGEAWSSASGPSSAAASTRTCPRSVAAVRLVAVGVGAREQQEVADEAAHPLRGAQRRAARPRGARRRATSASSSRFGEDARQRRAQLVRGVGDELALALRAPSSVSLREASRPSSISWSVRAELGDLVVGARARERRPGSRVSRDVARAGGERARSAPSRGGRRSARRGARAACRRGRRRRGTAGRA